MPGWVHASAAAKSASSTACAAVACVSRHVYLIRKSEHATTLTETCDPCDMAAARPPPPHVHELHAAPRSGRTAALVVPVCNHTVSVCLRPSSQYCYLHNAAELHVLRALTLAASLRGHKSTVQLVAMVFGLDLVAQARLRSAGFAIDDRSHAGTAAFAMRPRYAPEPGLKWPRENQSHYVQLRQDDLCAAACYKVCVSSHATTAQRLAPSRCSSRLRCSVHRPHMACLSPASRPSVGKSATSSCGAFAIFPLPTRHLLQVECMAAPPV